MFVAVGGGIARERREEGEKERERKRGGEREGEREGQREGGRDKERKRHWLLPICPPHHSITAKLNLRMTDAANQWRVSEVKSRSIP